MYLPARSKLRQKKVARQSVLETFTPKHAQSAPPRAYFICYTPRLRARPRFTTRVPFAPCCSGTVHRTGVQYVACHARCL